MAIKLCDRTPAVQGPRVVEAPFVATALSQVDLGASVLAEVDNARLAIVLQDRVAANNDVVQALAFAGRLVDQPSRIFDSKPPINEPSVSKIAVYHTKITAFGAIAKLASAQAELDGNLAEADRDLRAIQIGVVPRQLLPTDLLLLRAAASIDMARNAVSEGRIPELRTQLLTAQLALKDYAGLDRATEAKTLAAVIGQALSHADTLGTTSPYRISIWLDTVVAWTGSERWSAVATQP